MIHLFLPLLIGSYQQEPVFNFEKEHFVWSSGVDEESLRIGRIIAEGKLRFTQKGQKDGCTLEIQSTVSNTKCDLQTLLMGQCEWNVTEQELQKKYGIPRTRRYDASIEYVLKIDEDPKSPVKRAAGKPLSEFPKDRTSRVIVKNSLEFKISPRLKGGYGARLNVKVPPLSIDGKGNAKVTFVITKFTVKHVNPNGVINS